LASSNHVLAFPMNIAFFGLGVMGDPMAANLITSGQHSVSLFDLDSEKTNKLVKLGGLAITNIGASIAEADIVMTSLPGPKQIDAFAFGDEGVFANAKPGSTWIELSTNNLATCQKMTEAAKQNGVALLDSPVSGGDEGATTGTLTIMVGGDEAAFMQHKPIYDLIGKDIRFLGKSGAGYAAKISQVVLCYLHSIALAEAMMLGVKAGVNATEMLSIIQNSTGRSYVADRYGPPILNGDYDPSFTLGMALKDMKLALELAQTLEIKLPMCDMVTDIYQQACDTFGLDANHLMAVRVLEEDSDTYLRA
jgi:3-hydroxyisobutyrate dehydrogenase-like beta-hydroxyacid dehydrogenase